MGRIGGFLAGLLLWLVLVPLLAFSILPPFLDRIYYDGPASSHYDGARFQNPDGDALAEAVRTGGRPPWARFLPGGPPSPAWPLHVRVQQTDVRHLPPLKAGEMRAIWVGHATVLVQVPGLNILTDPIWSDVTGPYNLVGPRRVMPPGIDFDALPRIDLILVSHNHYDHLDIATLRRLWQRDRPLIVTGLGNDRVMEQAGITARALDWGQAVASGPARVHVLRNHHWSSRWGFDRNRALWSAFLIETPAGNIFFAGDTGPGDLRWPLEARRWGPVRLALLPIGTFRFNPGQLVNGSHIGPREAVQLFRLLDPAAALPIHWGTFRLSTESWGTPPALLELFTRCGGVAPGRFRARRPGVPLLVPANPAPLSQPLPGPCPTETALDRYP